MSRRLALLAWAREQRAFIVEDDYASEFVYTGPRLTALQGLDEDGRVIYVGTLNKALFPGLRLGYLVIPETLLPTYTNARYLMDRQPPSLHQAVTAEFMHQGHFAAHIRRMRHLYRNQRDALVATLARQAAEHLAVAGSSDGMQLIAYFKRMTSDAEFETVASQAGITVRAISRFYRSAPPRSGLMLGFSGFPSQVVVPAAARLAALVGKFGSRKPMQPAAL